MTKGIRKLFHLFPGEGRGALAFAILAFFWAAAVTSGLKFADALFLLHIGPENLPTLYAISAGCMILIASLLIYSFHTFAPHHVFISALSFATLFYLSIFFAFFVEAKSPWVWYLFRIFGSVNFAVIGTSFWTFIDQYYHMQDAKRLFSLFNSMIFLGISVTGLVMLFGWFEFQTLSLLIACFLLMAIGLILYIHRTARPIHDDTHIEGEPLSYKKFLLGILRSRFTLLLMLSNLLIYLLMSTTEFNYYSTFNHIFDTGKVAIGDEAEARLTQFLGQALTGVSITNLLFGLFFYSRLLRRLGIGFLLPITPLLLIFTYGAWQLEDALWIALLGYFVIEGVTYVIDDANFNLLLNAVPTHFKPKIRIAIESFFEPIGTLLAAALLSTQCINPKFLGLLLSVILLAVAVALRRQYLRAIWHNLAENAIHFSRSLPEWFYLMAKPDRKAAEEGLLSHILQHDDAPFAIQCLMLSKDRTGLLKLLKEGDALTFEEKIHFIRLVEVSSFYADPLVIEMAQRWLMHAEDPQLIQELYWFLAKKGLLHPDKLNDELASENLKLKGAAILTLLTAQADFSPEEAWANKLLAVEKIGQLFESEGTEEIQMGLKILSSDPSTQNLDISLSYLTHSSPAVKHEAALAVFQMASPKMHKAAPRLAALLLEVHETESREYLLKALGAMGDPQPMKLILRATTHFRPSERRLAEETIASLGLKNVPFLFSLLNDCTLSDRARLTTGKALGKIALFQLRAHLDRVLQPEIERAVFFWQNWHNIKDDPELQLLSDTLRADYFSVLDFIIQLLGVAGEVEDTELLSRALKSPFLKLRSQGIETIEKTCEPLIFRRLQPLLENTLPHYQPISLTALLTILQHSSSIADKIVAYTYMKKLNLSGWQLSLKQEMTRAEELFKHFAYELLET